MSGADVTARVQVDSHPYCAGIIDVFEGDANGVGWTKRAPDKLDSLRNALADAVEHTGVVGVIAKATQGKDFCDPSFAAWMRVAADLGLLRGGYHFASNTEPGELQAAWFLAHVREAGCDDASTLHALDDERNPRPELTETLAQAEAFVQAIRNATGRWPLWYGDASFHKRLTNAASPLVHCPEWVAAFGGSLAHGGPPASPAHRAAGKTWAMWQFTDGKYCASDLPMDSTPFHRCDRSVVRMSADALRAAWPALAPP